MPGATPLGLRFPLQGETVDATSWQNLANDIDALMTTVDGLRDRAIKPATAAIQGSFTGTAVATGVDSVYNDFTNVNWDNAGFANVGVNPDRLTLSTGVYYASALGSLTAYTTLTFFRVGLLAGGRIWAMQHVDTLAAASFPAAQAAGVVVVTAPATALQMRIRWNGTGGPATVFDGLLSVYKIRELADV